MDTGNNNTDSCILEHRKSMDSYKLLRCNGYCIGYYLRTDPNKEIAEDALLVMHGDDYIILAICDGVGGSDRSYRAAKNTLSYISELPLDINPDDFQQELLSINKKLIALEGSPQTTLTLAKIYKDHYTCFQAGDSALLQCSNQNNLKYRSPIHSLVGKALEGGEITEQKALEHPDLHIVSNVLGSDDAYIEVSSAKEINQNDTLLLTSDGLLDNYTSDELIDIVSKVDLEHACTNLVASAIAKKNLVKDADFNKLDDISFICLKRG